jgi:hypothetical protein
MTTIITTAKVAETDMPTMTGMSVSENKHVSVFIHREMNDTF